jgi:hypothetical protein
VAEPLGLCVGYFFFAETKYLIETRGRIYFGSQFQRIQSIMAGMVWQSQAVHLMEARRPGGQEARRQEERMPALASFFLFSLLFHPGSPPVYWMVPPTVLGVLFPLSYSCLEKPSQTHLDGCS